MATVLHEARATYIFRLWAYVLMPNHVHLLLWPLETMYDIAKIDCGIKGLASKRYRKHLEQTEPDRVGNFMVKSRGAEVFRFWQPGGGFDRNLYNPKPVHQAIGYIEANPVRKGLVPEPALYRWSSAYARETGTGLIPDTFNMPVNMPNPQYQRVGVV